MANPGDPIDPAAVAAALKAAAAEAGGVIDSVTGKFKDLSGATKALDNDLLSYLGNSLTSWDSIHGAIDKAKSVFGEFGDEAMFAMLPLMNILPAATNLFGELGKSGMKAGDDISKTFANVNSIPIVKKMLGGVGTALDRVFDSASKAQQLQMGLVGIAAASGTLSDVIQGTSADFGKLADHTATYNKRIFETAASSGMLITTVADYASALARIPGALDTQIDKADAAGHSLNMLDASIKIASAFQIDHSTVVKDLTFAYEKFSTVGDKALRFVARMGTISQDLKIPMDIVSKTVKDAAGGMLLMGDNTQATMNILEKISPILSGKIGVEGISQITKDMTAGIVGMDLATKAFISQASGGRGGLSGAFKIEQMMQQGKTDEVLEMTMSAMKKQFKAPVVTLDEAVKDPGKSSEFQKQVSYLTDVAKIATSQQEAYRILDIMKAGGPGAGAALADAKKTPEEALQHAVTLGTSMQEKGNNQLITLANEALKMETISAGASLTLVQQMFGMKGNSQDDLRAKMSEGRESAHIGSKTSAKEQTNDGMKTAANLFTSGVELAGRVLNSGMNGLVGLGKNKKDADTEEEEKREKAKKDAKEQREKGMAPGQAERKPQPVGTHPGLGVMFVPAPTMGPLAAREMMAPPEARRTTAQGNQENAAHGGALNVVVHVKGEVDIMNGMEKVAKAAIRDAEKAKKVSAGISQGGT